MQNNTMRRGLTWRDPDLFIKKGKGRYSTACPSQYSKHPIVLNDNEKKYIDEKDKSYGVKSYDESITYGSKEKFHYICPRFWCLNDENGKQRSITLKEINEGKCGGWDALIPRDAKKISKGKRIYEFTDQRFHRERYQMEDTENILVYKPMYPGFQPKTKHPNNLCIPCCFGRPTGLSKEAQEEGWSVNEKANKLFFKKGKKDVDKIKFQSIVGNKIGVLDGKNGNDYMYKSTGEGKEGPGPEFERDDVGNIKLETIKGTPQTRDLPAVVRLKTHAECDQSPKENVPSETVTTLSKMEETPAWELFPLKMGQLGYLPEAVQKFFNYNQRPPKNNSNLMIKKDKPVFLRKGMERNKNQSFLSCIADMYNFKIAEKSAKKLEKKTEKSIKWIKNIIVNHLTLDNFITFQNGTLIDVFYKETDITMDEHKDTKIFKMLKRKKEDKYLRKIIISMNNFKTFIMSDAEIDYKYLWDIICSPKNNGGLFENGLNLLILKSTEDDITNKIEVVCPTNHYSNEHLDDNREILILYSRYDKYEPVYRYLRKTSDKYIVTKTFHLGKINEQAPQIGRMISKIKLKLIEDCKPLPSSHQYRFKENISAKKIMHIISHISIYGDIEFTQVLNRNTKIIGIIFEAKGKSIYIPTLPSPVNTNLPFILIEEPGFIKSFDDTLENLKTLHKISKNKIPCKPLMKIVENEIVVGIVTETNQFIPVLPEPNDSDGNLKTIRMESGVKNYLAADNEIRNLDDIDRERITAVNNIRLESQLYNSFRNILRIIIHSMENKDKHIQSFLDILEDITIIYNDKIRQIIEMCKTIMSKYVEFSDYKISPHVAVNKIFKCIQSGESKCSEDSPPCFYTKSDGICKLQIPSRNLISGSVNEKIYYSKLADELIKFRKIRMFVFNPQTFLTFQHTSYNLKENEIILLEELLYGEYFEDIILQKKNPYILTKNIYDTSNPAKTIPYKDTFALNNFFKPSVNPCLVEKSEIKLKWNTYLEKNNIDMDGFEFIEFKHTINCTWELVVLILNDFNIKISALELRDILIQLYSQNLKRYGEQITDIWKKEGKPFAVHNLQNDIKGTIDLTGYYLTPFDMFLLFTHYNCPVVIVSRNGIPPDHKKFMSFADESETSYIILGGVWNIKKQEVPPRYGLFKKLGTIKIDTSYFGEKWQTITSNHIKTIEEFYEYAQIPAPKKIPKLKLKGRKLGKMKLKGLT